MSERAREDRDIARKWARHKKRLATVAKKTERIQVILRDHAFDLQCTDHMQVKRKSTGEVVDCPDEQTFFQLARRPWLAPEDRR